MIMLIKNIAVIFILIGMPLIGMDHSKHALKLEHRKRNPDELFRRLPYPFRARPLIQLNALDEQADTISCAYRAIHHAQCIGSAAARAKKHGLLLKESLKELLARTDLLDETYRSINSYLDTNYPLYNRRGLTDNQILGVCEEQIASLKANVLVIGIEEDDEIFAISDPTLSQYQSPLEYSSNFIHGYNSKKFPESRCKIDLEHSHGFHYQLKQLEKPWHACHFMCTIPGHVFLATAISDNLGAVLYVIDSNNTNIEKCYYTNRIVSKLLAYVEAHNNKNKKAKTS